MNKTISFKLDIKLIIIIVLAIGLVATILFWQPWAGSDKAPSRTVTTTGEGTVSSEPDEYDFYPFYQASGTDRQATINKVNQKVNDVIDQLKKLGVSEDKISVSENSYMIYWQDNKENTISITITIKVEGKELAQKVQDYLITTTPSGQITPYPTFSKDKRKSLETEARTLALKDAKSKAEKAVSEVGASLGKVVTISDNQLMVMPMVTNAADSASSSNTKTSLPISTSKQDVSVSVQVVYELR